MRTEERPWGAIDPVPERVSPGRFEVREARPGVYDIDVRASGYTPTRVEGVTVGGSDVQVPTIALGRGVRLHGTARAPDGVLARDVKLNFSLQSKPQRYVGVESEFSPDWRSENLPGWGGVAIGAWAEWALRAVVLAGVAGLIIAGLRRGNTSEPWWRRVVWLFGITVAVAWLAAVVRFEAQEGFYVPRGRYIHLAIVPTIWLLILGIERLAPQRWRMTTLFALTLLFILIDTAAWAGALSASYYR